MAGTPRLDALGLTLDEGLKVIARGIVLRGWLLSKAQRELRSIFHNLINVETGGYKKERDAIQAIERELANVYDRLRTGSSIRCYQGLHDVILKAKSYLKTRSDFDTPRP